jgi:two-component system, OmpR family, sensor histidine kinase MtrB
VSDPTGTVAAEPRPPDETPDGAGATAAGTSDPAEQAGVGADAGGPGPDPTTPFPRLHTPRRDRPIRRLLHRMGLGGLRRRILLTFTLGSLTLSAFLAVTTYGLVRSNLIEQRYVASRQAAYTDAATVQRELRSGPPTLAGASEQLRQLGVQRPVIYYRGAWSAGISRFGNQEIPPALITRVIQDETDARMITKVGKNTMMVFGIPIPGVGAYFEFFDLGDDDQTLSNVALSLFLASVITTLLGVLLGVFAARRAVRPVAEAAQAAKAIAGGHLGTRLPPSDDPDLGVLAGSFNDMASALQVRIERDARFASDVSHELRSPLMTLSASVEVMEARRAEMPERAQAALDLLSSDVSRFQGLVEDLLEISRFDAGAIRLHLEDLQVSEFVRNAVAVSSAPSSSVTVNERAERAVIRGDRRRLARVLANLIDNANAYGGGDPELTITDANLPDEPVTHIQVAVEDHGPGVPVEERALIFERFSRGATAGRRAGSEGAGLGLALVDEHVRIHGGRVWVEDRIDGTPGARFVIELPATEPPAAEEEGAAPVSEDDVA